MPPQASFVIKQNTPEAIKLEHRIHQELKELWDPAADATVARYLTAMLAKGYDRKKIHSQLKSILQEDATVQLLDWLYKHIRLHGNEYQSKQTVTSSKPTQKPLASAAKPPHPNEDELRLEDLEAQQLEGSDLDEEPEDGRTGPSDVPGAQKAETAASASAPAGESEAAVKQERQSGKGAVQNQVRNEPGPSGPSVTVQVPSAAPPPQAKPSEPAAGQAAEQPSARTGRRHHEPIPIPKFDLPPRPKADAAVEPSGASAAARALQQPATNGASARNSQDAQAAAAPAASADEQEKRAEASQERRRLKSSVVLDWVSWQKQKPPGDQRKHGRSPERQGKGDAAQPSHRRAVGDKDERPAARSRGASREPPVATAAGPPDCEPGLVRSSSGRAEEPRSGRDNGDPEREGRRESDRGRQRADYETERREGRQQGRDGDGSSRKDQERSGDGGGSRRRGSSRDRQGRRSRSRSRSRSPRGRRSARSLLAPANLLRTALRGVDGLSGGGAANSPAPRGGAAAAGQREGPAGAEAAKPSVFARLGMATPREEGLGRGSRAGRGAERSVDIPVPGGKKRGLDGTSETVDGDATILGSPPKAARGILADKPGPAATSGPSASQPRPSAAAARGAGRQRIPSPAPASAADLSQHPAAPPPGRQRSAGADGQPAAASSRRAGTAEPPLAASEPVKPSGQAGGGGAAAVSAVGSAAAGDDDSKTRELEELRRQMAAMQEQLARMASGAINGNQPAPPLQQQGNPQQSAEVAAKPPLAGRPAVFDRLQPADTVRPPLQSGRAGPGAGALGMGFPGRGGGMAAGGRVGGGPMAMPLLVPDDVVIEGGAGSPPGSTSPSPLVVAGQVGGPAGAGRGASALSAEERLLAAELDVEMRSLVVGNVHFLANEDVLRAHFSVVGPVQSVTIIRDNFTQQPTGMAVVEMATEAATQAAAALSGSLMMDMPIVVTLKAALFLQGMGLSLNMHAVPGEGLEGMGIPGNMAAGGLGPGFPSGSGPGRGRLNPSAAPFVPAGTGGALGGAARPPFGGPGGAGGRAPWAGGRGRGRGAGRSNVWVRDALAAAPAPTPAPAAAAGSGAADEGQ